MDETLSKFVDKTGCDPSFARDLLQGKEWNFDEALKAFHEFSLGGSMETSPQERKKLTKPQRGISIVNSDIVQKARDKVLHRDGHVTDNQNEGFEEMARFTFVLPDLSSYPKDFADFLRDDLIETSALVALEQSGHLNWWSDIGICQRLVPLATVGDGNCLLHAASLGMWGFHDRMLTLRKALFGTLISDSTSGAIKRRWKLEQYQRNMEAGGLVYTDDEWEKEWEEVLRLASTSRKKLNNKPKLNKNQSLPSIDEGGEKVPSVGENGPEEPAKEQSSTSSEPTPQQPSENKEKTLNKNASEGTKGTEGTKGPKGTEGAKGTEGTEGTKVESNVSTEDKKEETKHLDENEEEREGAFESLEEIHVFVLAHVLRRPIIIIADKFLRDFSGDPIAPIPFGGIYLPCECPAEACLKTPLILAFESAHFSAVVASEGKGKQEKESLVTAMPVVNHDYQLLPIHFSVDPGESFDWSTLDKETELPPRLLLTEEQKLELLRKYLDIVHIKIPNSAKAAHSQGKVDAQQPQKGSQTNEKKKEVVKEGEKGISWLSSQLNKVGNLAGKIKGSLDLNNLCAAKLKTDQKPEYYKEMINNYIESSKERFEERKKTQEAKKSEPGKSQSESYQCPTPGCQLYGRADTNYLCSGCYRTQKSASEAGIYKKPSGSEGKGEGKATFKSYLPPISTYLEYPNSINTYDTGHTGQKGQTSTRNIPLNNPKTSSYAQVCQSNIVKAESNRCLTDGCSFYGRPDQKGFCSSCYKKKAH